MSIYVMCASLPCNIVFLRETFQNSFTSLIQFGSISVFPWFSQQESLFKGRKVSLPYEISMSIITSCIASLPCNIALDTSRLFLLLIQFAYIKMVPWFAQKKSHISFIPCIASMPCTIPFRKISRFLMFLIQFASISVFPWFAQKEALFTECIVSLPYKILMFIYIMHC